MKINGKPDGGGGGVITSLTATENGTYIPSSGVDGFAPVEVDVPIPSFITETLNVSENGTYTPGTGIDGFNQVSVEVLPLLQNKTINVNGSYTADEGYYGLNTIIVSVPDVPAVTETLSVTDNGIYIPSVGVDGFSKVTVDVPQSVTGYTQKDLTEKTFTITDLNNSASYVASRAFMNYNGLNAIHLNNCSIVYSEAFSGCGDLTTVSLPNTDILKGSVFNRCGKLEDVYLPKCEYVELYAFAYCYSLTSIDLPKCKELQMNTFFYCQNLQSVSFPELVNLFSNVFKNCTSLTSIDLPECLSIGNNAFEGCPLTTVSLPKCISISNSVFSSYSMSQIDLPMCLTIGENVFTGHWQNGSPLTTLNAPFCTQIGNGTLNNCESLTSVSLPLCYNVYASMGYLNISEVSLPVVSSMSYNMFNNASNLVSLTLGTGTYIIPTYNNQMLTGTPILSGNGSIYVDAAMYDKWITANGWSSLSSVFVSVGNTDPMISYSDGILYGKTSFLNHTWNSYVEVGGTITSLSFPNCKIIYAGVGLSTVTSVYFPECEVVLDGFNNLSALTTIDLPNCKILRGGFRGCGQLTSVSVPECRALVASQTFHQCYNLSSINLPKCEFISANGIGEVAPGCSLTLGYSKMVFLSGTLGDNNRITSIYVPASLVSIYKEDKGYWGTYYSSKIFPIE